MLPLPRSQTFLLALLLLLAGGGMSRATWYSENVSNGADIIMMDLRWPWWPSGTYFANWNTSFNPKPNNITFYAGFTGTVPDGPGFLPNADESIQEAFRPGNVWTFWGSDSAGTPVRFTDVAPNLYIKNDYGGEGSSGTVGSEGWPFIKQKRWYTMLGRVWAADGTHAFVARWVKDQANGQWHHIGTARLPIPATSFTGNSGFIEPLSNEKAVRSLHRRLGYFRKDGKWQKSDTISIDKTQYVVVNTVPEGDHEYVAIEYAQTPGLLPQRLTGVPLSGDRKHFFQTRQPEQPSLDHPAVTDVRALRAVGQVAVSWQVPAKAAPAFGYRVEVFENAACVGQPSVVKEEINPSARHTLINTSVPFPTVRLTVIDVFDQTTSPVLATATASELATALPFAGPTEARLHYQLRFKDDKRQTNYFYEVRQKPNEEHHWLSLGELKDGRVAKSGLARGFDLSLREQRRAGCALEFWGRLHVPSNGIYLFRAQIDGAYQLTLDDTHVLSWDGQHGTTEKAAFHAMTSGDHALRVTHLVDRLPAQNFRIEWEGPGLVRQPIPLESLRVVKDDAGPEVSVLGQAVGNGTGRVLVRVNAKGRKVNRTVLFLDRLELAESQFDQLEFTGALPQGSNHLWARLTHDGNQTADSEPFTLQVEGSPAPPNWTTRNVGDAKAAFGLYSTGPDSFQFFGNGMHTATRKVTGDFTATMRVDHYNGQHGEPVNRRAWVGLTAREQGEKLNWEWGRDFHLVQTAGDGLRASADFTDFGAGRISSYELPQHRPWLRIMREGNIWTAWTSVDGQAWELGAYQFKKARAEMDVGVFFSALPQEAQAHYHASVSKLSIVPGTAADAAVPAPPVARQTDGDRLTGIVMARSTPDVVVARSTRLGLLRSADKGKNWSPANGQLTGPDLAVRSVAIHPTNPQIMLRAGNGGLWKTTNGGQQWLKLPFAGDFDGTGPSALCGEVVAFDLRNAETVYAGCESSGFFRSTNAGASWENLGLRGERITAVTVWGWERYYPAPARGKSHLCAITSPDRWMSLLGRGEPVTKTAAMVSRSYLSPDSGQSLVVSDERGDTGFFNVAFDKAMQSVNEMRYATAHGYQSQVFAGTHMALYPKAKHLESMRPFTALYATAMGEEKFGRTITQALDPEQRGRISRSERWAFEWDWLPLRGEIPQGGLISVWGDVSQGNEWWFVFSDGLFHSSDGGRTLKKVMNALGVQNN